MPTRTVSSTAGLYDALASASGGDTILLEGGNYGSFALNLKSGFDFTFPSNVTIASKDPGDPAVFTGMDVRKAANLTFDGITFDYTFKAGDLISRRPFNVSGSDGITIRDCTFDGDVARGVSAASDGYGWGAGLFVRDSKNVTIEGSEFFNWYRGLLASSVTGLTLRGNDIHSIRSDGMNLFEVNGALIEKNHIHDFKGNGAGDHRDMIQFWSYGADVPSKDIVIRDNLLDVGQGTATQSIFMRNEGVDYGTGGREIYYRNILIEDNTIINGHAHGISVGQSEGLTIRRNSVLHADGGLQDGADRLVEIPRISVHPASLGVSITQNAVVAINGTRPGWTVAGNAFVQDQDPGAPNYYYDAFVASTLKVEDGRNTFVAREGGLLDRLDAGSSLTLDAPAGLAAMFHMTQPNPATRIFDASASLLNGADLPAGTTYTWAFGDGTTASGLRVMHSYTGGGEYDVRLTVRLPDGRTGSESLAVPVQSSEVLSLDLADRSFTAFHHGEVVELSPLAVITSAGLQLGGTGVVATVARGHVVDVLGSKDVSIGFTLDADRAGASGDLFRLHGSFAVSVGTKGEIGVRAWQQDGPNVTVSTRGANVSNGAEHDVVIRLNDGRLDIWVDGALKGSAAMALPLGGVSGFSTHPLTFGNAWGSGNFKGDIRAFDIAVGSDDFLPTAKTTVLTAAPGAAPAPAPVYSQDLVTVEKSTLSADSLEAADLAVAGDDAPSAKDVPLDDDARFEFQGAALLDSQAA